MVKFVGMSSDAQFWSVGVRSGVGVMPSIDDALHSIIFIFGRSFVVPFFVLELLERLLAHVVFRLSIHLDSTEVSIASGCEEHHAGASADCTG
eukprot:15367195-Ditylum_brightwellii.AAC.2